MTTPLTFNIILGLSDEIILKISDILSPIDIYHFSLCSKNLNNLLWYRNIYDNYEKYRDKILKEYCAKYYIIEKSAPNRIVMPVKYKFNSDLINDLNYKLNYGSVLSIYNTMHSDIFDYDNNIVNLFEYLYTFFF